MYNQTCISWGFPTQFQFSIWEKHLFPSVIHRTVVTDGENLTAFLVILLVILFDSHYKITFNKNHSIHAIELTCQHRRQDGHFVTELKIFAWIQDSVLTCEEPWVNHLYLRKYFITALLCTLISVRIKSPVNDVDRRQETSIPNSHSLKWE